MSAARAYLSGGRVGGELSRLDRLRARIAAVFAEAGAKRVEPETLLDADLLLDLYGEDIRGRAYILQDPVLGELCLRPDFTVPVSRLHIEEGGAPARYAYDGLVWRRQDADSPRPTEYLQCGVELMGGDDPAEEEAEAFRLIRDALGPLAQAPRIGDLGVLSAAIDGLTASPIMKQALRRHLWRPARFKQLLNRFANPPDPAGERASLIAANEATRAEAIAAAGKFVGLRSADEILFRLKRIAAAEHGAPMPDAERELMEALLSLRCRADEAPTRLAAMSLPALEEAIAAFQRRLDTLDAHGVDLAELTYEAAFGRAMEYYDGFVFEFPAPRGDLPPLGGGGRYDGLCRALGADAGVHAVGGILRPEAMIAAGAEA